MKFLEKDPPFILLNIIVSAATLLVVLYLAAKKPLHKAETTQPIITPIQGSQAPPVPPNRADPEDRLLRIEGVLGWETSRWNISCCAIQAIAR